MLDLIKVIFGVPRAFKFAAEQNEVEPSIARCSSVAYSTTSILVILEIGDFSLW